jgi:cysteinyl-tRNA synthetase
MTLFHRFCAAMDNDLDTPSAMAVIFDAVRSVQTVHLIRVTYHVCASLRRTVIEIAAAGIGLFLRDTSAVDDEVHELAKGALDEARASKNFAKQMRFVMNFKVVGYM